LDKTLDTPDIAAARAPRDLAFRDDINGLRALAVIGVVAFHADRALVPGGFAGVDVFFVISGFLITRIVLSDLAAGKFSLLDFYARRARRILPAMLLVVAFVWVVGWFRAAPTQFRDIGGTILGNSYFTVNFWLMRLANIGGYFGADSLAKPLLHLWSLSIEEQFYLVWSVLMVCLFWLRTKLVALAIAAMLVASFAASVVLTPIDPVAAFYLPGTRGWALALGALIAYREVFLLHALPYPSRRVADLGAGLGVALIVFGYFWLNEAEPFPGWRVAIPVVGCGLVIAHPGSWIGKAGLGNRVAAFFGLISYPLYLWHWPLFAYAHIWPGVIPTPAVMLALSIAAIALATLTYWFIEEPTKPLFRRRPYALALILVALLTGTGVVGNITYFSKGFPDRFPPLVTRIFDYDVNGAQGPALMRCFYQNDPAARSTSEERERAKRYFEAGRCGEIADPSKPTILIIGDSHAASLFAGMTAAFGDKANVIALAAVFCVPLVDPVATDEGVAGTPRCAAVNDYVFRRIREIRPDVVLVGGYYAQYDHEANWRYPGFLDAIVLGAKKLREGGVPSVVIAGELPTWQPWMPILVGRDVLETGRAQKFSHVGVRPDSLETDRAMAAKPWPEGVTYVSQAAKLCDADGCRRLVGPNLPQDMLAVDYGHYSLDGSIFAVKAILAPAIEAEIRRVRAAR